MPRIEWLPPTPPEPGRPRLQWLAAGEVEEFGPPAPARAACDFCHSRHKPEWLPQDRLAPRLMGFAVQRSYNGSTQLLAGDWSQW